VAFTDKVEILWFVDFFTTPEQRLAMKNAKAEFLDAVILEKRMASARVAKDALVVTAPIGIDGPRKGHAGDLVKHRFGHHFNGFDVAHVASIVEHMFDSKAGQRRFRNFELEPRLQEVWP